jgi:hypothetical protein
MAISARRVRTKVWLQQEAAHCLNRLAGRVEQCGNLGCWLHADADSAGDHRSEGLEPGGSFATNAAFAGNIVAVLAGLLAALLTLQGAYTAVKTHHVA